MSIGNTVDCKKNNTEMDKMLINKKRRLWAEKVEEKKHRIDILENWNILNF
jgi:hypothetical protein